MSVIGVFGKSGSGKSTVCKYIKNQGRDFNYRVIDVDKIHKEALMIYKDDIISIFDARGYKNLPFDVLIQNFFKDKDLREEVNKVLFPFVKDAIKSTIKNTRSYFTVFLDAPLLYDMELNELCDKIILIECNLHENLDRLMKRTSIDLKDAIIRYNAIDTKKPFDYLINTNNDNEWREEIEEALSDIRRQFRPLD